MIADGSIIARPGDEDPGAIALMHKLAEKRRDRWPGFAVDFPRAPEERSRPSARRLVVLVGRRWRRGRGQRVGRALHRRGDHLVGQLVDRPGRSGRAPRPPRRRGRR